MRATVRRRLSRFLDDVDAHGMTDDEKAELVAELCERLGVDETDDGPQDGEE